MYKDQANSEKAEYKDILQEVIKGIKAQDIPDAVVDEFVKNCHQLRLMRGKLWGESDHESLCRCSTPIPVLSLNCLNK